MSDNTDPANAYLVWSVEHDAWWASPSGYTQRLSQARRFTRLAALDVCANAMPGTVTRLGMLPELPVSLHLLGLLIAGYKSKFPLQGEPWE